jgi:anti-anti-sigma factor
MAEAPVTSVEQLPAAVVVHVLARNLGKSEVDAMCDGVDEARKAAPAMPFIMDMSNVEFAGSLALGVIAGLNQEFRTRGQRLIFAGFQSNVRRSIEITRINQVLQIMDNVAAAVKSLPASAT